MSAPAPTPSLNTLLRGVARSFHLSIALLPQRLREPVAVAYLLARASDTVADSASAGADAKLDLLERLGVAYAACDLEPALAHELAALGSAGVHPQEQALLRRLPECVALLAAMPQDDRADVQQVLHCIVQGQALDLQRFPGGGIHALPDAAALEDYAYLVAGSVGEFWTDLCHRHVAHFADRSAREMRTLGRSFGIGLQLVNIVRDAGEDLAAGRCYFPADELAAAGLRPGEILGAADRFLPAWQRWQGEAMRRLADGLAYADAVHSRRVRASVALPALIGQRTLQRLGDAGVDGLRARVKVPRAQVYALCARMALGLASRRALRAGWDNRPQ